MERDDRVGLLAGRDDRVPVAREQAGQADPVRPFGEGDRSEAPRGVPPDLGGTQLRVGQEGDATGDDPVGIGLPPRLVEPVVPCPGHRQAELGVAGGGEDPPAEPGDLGGEVERCPDTVDVHVADAGVDVPAPAPHVLEAGRFQASRTRAAGRPPRSSPLVSTAPVELPQLTPLELSTTRGARSANRAGEPALEHVRRFDEVVVDRDDRVAHRRGSDREQGVRPGDDGHVDLPISRVCQRRPAAVPVAPPSRRRPAPPTADGG